MWILRERHPYTTAAMDGPYARSMASFARVTVVLNFLLDLFHSESSLRVLRSSQFCWSTLAG